MRQTRAFTMNVDTKLMDNLETVRKKFRDSGYKGLHNTFFIELAMKRFIKSMSEWGDQDNKEFEKEYKKMRQYTWDVKRGTR